MSIPFNILVTDHLHAAGWDLLRQDDDIIICGPFETREALLLAIPKADAIIIRSGTRVDMQLLDAAPLLKVIARAGARLDNVDVDTATHRGIMVINAADANVPAVAEHTFAMLLGLARDIPTGYLAMRRGEWPRHKSEERRVGFFIVWEDNRHSGFWSFRARRSILRPSI